MNEGETNPKVPAGLGHADHDTTHRRPIQKRLLPVLECFPAKVKIVTNGDEIEAACLIAALPLQLLQSRSLQRREGQPPLRRVRKNFRRKSLLIIIPNFVTLSISIYQLAHSLEMFLSKVS